MPFDAQNPTGVRAAFAGCRVFLTGATGFLGEALLERLLVELPDTRVVLLVRGKDGAGAAERVEQLLAKPAFTTLRDREGTDGLRRLVADRIEVLDGDLTHWPALPSDLDVVVHCAGEVSFDPAIDDGFATNALGVERLLHAIASGGARPHLVHVSTAYVNGMVKGAVAEARLTHDVDWRVEADAATRRRLSVEDASRSAARLEAFLVQARADHAREGPQVVAADAERRRRAWVDDQLIAAGRERAQSLGFTDCYTFTKAMGERVVEELAGDLPVTVVRPSIIESALERPYPGWIEGYKMADPIILAYGRGVLPDFPGVPDGVVDIVPVDLVVSAILTAAAHPPAPGGRRYLHLCTGARNPLTLAELHSSVRAHFVRHPLQVRDRGTIPVHAWTFPGSASLERRLRTGERVVDVADTVLGALPRSDRTRSAALSLDRTRGQLEFLRRYFDLFGIYAAAEVIYLDDEVAALEAQLPDDERELFGFDPRRIDWDHYLSEVHIPSITGLIRSITAAPRGPRDRVDPDLTAEATLAAEAALTAEATLAAEAGLAGEAALLGEAALTGEALIGEAAPSAGVVTRPLSRIVAVFDMDGTLLPSNVVESYLRLRLAGLALSDRARELSSAARQFPGWMLTERRDRGAFLREIYRQYAGASLAELEALVDEEIGPDMLARVSPAALRQVRHHRAAGHRTVLITGAILALTRPLAPLFDDVAAAELAVDAQGRATGRLASPPPVGEARPAWLRRYASLHDLDLSTSYAYADSASDLPLLRAVGRPVAVNPDITTLRAARAARWPVKEWRTSGRPLSSVAR